MGCPGMPEPDTDRENEDAENPDGEADLPIRSGTHGTLREQQNAPDRARRIPHFIELLLDDNEVTRWKSAEALGRIGDPIAVQPLIDTLWDDDVRVRKKAVWSLGKIGDMRAVPALRRLYRMENEDVKEIIMEAIEAINLRVADELRKSRERS